MKQLLTSAVLFLCCVATSFAQFSGTVTDAQGVKYTANDDDATCYVSGHEQTYSATITIPDTYEGRSVTSIGNSAFKDCIDLTSVTIPNSVTSIEANAFFYCLGCLTSVTIGNSVTSIGDWAFGYCSGLTSVNIPNSVTSIGDWAFDHCSGLTTVAIPNSVTSIGHSAFRDCSGLTFVTIPNSVTSIGVQSFQDCRSLTSVTIGNSVTSIGGWAFNGCSKLTSVTAMMSTPVAISSNCFANRSNVKLYVPAGYKDAYEAADYWKNFQIEELFFGSVIDEQGVVYTTANDYDATCYVSGHGQTYSATITIPETYEGRSVTSIGDEAFSGCSGLTSVTIPNSVTSIGCAAFGTCRSLTSVTIPNSVTTIESCAFYGCSGLTSVTIPNSVTSIRNQAFQRCSGLTSVTIPNSVTSIENAAFADSGLTSVTIPKSVISIEGAAFAGCFNLTSIIVEDGNTKYDSRENCNAIIESNSNTLIAGCKTTVIPNSVSSIGWYAFGGFSGLTSMAISNSVTSIGDYAFYGCSSLTSVDISNSVTSIGNWAFSGCNGLTSMRVNWEIPLETGITVFYNLTLSNITLYVPFGTKALYEAADVWKDFKEIVEFVDETDITQLDNVIYAENLQAYVGAQKGLTFKMKNTRPIRGFQFDLTLPAGVTPATYANGTIKCTLANGRLDEGDQHTISVSQQNDGCYRVLCGSLGNDVFTGNDGVIMTLTVNVADDMGAGSYPIVLKNIKLTETDISNYYETGEVVVSLAVDNYKQGDFSGDGKTDVSDYIGVANYILGDRNGNQNAKAADVDGNNKVDVSDYIGIANIILTGTVNGNQNAAARNNRQENSNGLDPQ